MSSMTESSADKPTGYYANPRKDILRLIPLDVRSLLDVGCGEGVLARAAKDRCSLKFVAGIELFGPAAAKAREVLDDVRQMDLERADLPYGDDQFDCIVCADVLEHLQDPWAALRKLRRVLGSEGVLVASIPNLANLGVVKKILRDRFEYESSGVLDRTHLRFFTLHTIRAMFAECGFEIVTIERKRRRSFFHRHPHIWSFGYIREGGVSSFSIVARKLRGEA